MPYVTIRVFKKYAKPEVKAKLIARLSEAAVDVIAEATGEDKEKVLAKTWCIIEEIPSENWGVNGVPVTK